MKGLIYQPYNARNVFELTPFNVSLCDFVCFIYRLCFAFRLRIQISHKFFHSVWREKNISFDFCGAQNTYHSRSKVVRNRYFDLWHTFSLKFDLYFDYSQESRVTTTVIDHTIEFKCDITN